MRKLIRLLIVSLLLCIPSFAANAVYLANAAAGGNTGADCANAKAYTYFNSSGNWSATPTGIQIGPDTTVRLCGTIGSATVGTGISLLVAQGSGSSGHPVIILFESGAILQGPDFGAGGSAINLDNQSFITVDGGGTGNAGAGTFVANGIIQATLSGTAGGGCIGGACNKNNGGTGISATTTSHITVKNLKIFDIYLKTSTSDAGNPDWATYFCIHASPSSDLLIDNVWTSDSGEGFAPNGNNVEIRNSNLQNESHEIALGAGSTSWSNTWIHDNNFGSMSAWDGACPPCDYHHDGIHIFPGGPGFYLSVFIYNNTFAGDVGGQNPGAPTGWIYAEQTSMTGGTLWVFNNLLLSSPYRSAPALFGLYSGTIHAVNNSFFTNGYTGGGLACDFGLSDATIADSKNNICGGESFSFKVQSGTTVSGTGAINFNGYIDGSASGNSDNFSYPGNDTQSLTTWKSTALPGAATHDANSFLVTLTAMKLNGDGTLQSGSPAIGTGANLFSTCNGQAVPGLGALCNDKNGVARPNSAWDVGAIQSGSTPTVSTPTFSPVAGTYFATQSVTISTSTGGAIICYTVDNSTPTANGAGTCTHGTTYSVAVSVATSETVKAIGSLSGDTDSSVGSAAYVINATVPAAPTGLSVIISYLNIPLGTQ